MSPVPKRRPASSPGRRPALQPLGLVLACALAGALPALPAGAGTRPDGERLASISTNPAAAEIVTGSGRLGRMLGLDPDWGVRLGGLWVGSGNYLATGGIDPGTPAFASLLIVDLGIDLEKAVGLPGALVGAEFLQFNAQPANTRAGTVSGYNSLVAAPPLDRTQLYQLWWRQSFFDDKLIFRVGKSVATFDFANVTRPVPTVDPALSIPSVTGLGFTSIFVLPTMLGFIPGYYDSAYGVTVTVAPTKELYFRYGGYDGSGAEGVRTGEHALPRFDGHYLHAGEVGYSWLLGEEAKPGGIGVGTWWQTGRLRAGALEENGAHGFYAFGAQRLWFQRPGVDASGVSAFFQLGVNDARTPLADLFVGGGITGFGLVPGRPADSMGLGFGWARMNQDLGLRGHEVMAAAYYQLQLFDGVFVQPMVSWIPNPGAAPGVPGALALTANATLLF